MIRDNGEIEGDRELVTGSWEEKKNYDRDKEQIIRVKRDTIQVGNRGRLLPGPYPAQSRVIPLNTGAH